MSHSNRQPTARELGQRARRSRDSAHRQYERVFEQYMSGAASQRDLAAATARSADAEIRLAVTVAR